MWYQIITFNPWKKNLERKEKWLVLTLRWLPKKMNMKVHV